jgi:hypothetical protein
MIRRIAVLASLFASAALACQIVAGIERVEKVDPTPEAGPPEVEPPPPDPCDHVFAPRAPESDDPGEDLPDFILAVRTFSLYQSDGGPSPGFDLDGVCTCDERPGSVEGGASSCVRPGKACDLDGGVDNNGAQLIASLAALPGVDDSVNVTNRIKNGRQTLLLVISRYNGKANDKEVKLGLVPSDGIRDDAGVRCPGSVQDPVGGHWSPTWCGTDPWSIVTDTVVVEPQATLGFQPIATGTGYVADYKVIVRVEFGTTTVPFGAGGLEMGSPEAVIDLVPLDENLQPRDKSRPPTPLERRLWRVPKGVLAGRLPAPSLLAAAGTIPTPGTMGRDHLCTSFLFSELKKTICDGLDIARTRSFDFAPNRACDALSMAVGFTADPAVWSRQFYREPDPGNECTPGSDGRPVDAGGNVVYRCGE